MKPFVTLSIVCSTLVLVGASPSFAALEPVVSQLNYYEDDHRFAADRFSSQLFAAVDKDLNFLARTDGDWRQKHLNAMSGALFKRSYVFKDLVLTFCQLHTEGSAYIVHMAPADRQSALAIARILTHGVRGLSFAKPTAQHGDRLIYKVPVTEQMPGSQVCTLYLNRDGRCFKIDFRQEI